MAIACCVIDAAQYFPGERPGVASSSPVFFGKRKLVRTGEVVCPSLLLGDWDICLSYIAPGRGRKSVYATFHGRCPSVPLYLG